VLALHRIREQLLKQRVALTNQLHGLLLEFGLVLPRRVGPLRARLTALLDEQRVPPLLWAATRTCAVCSSMARARSCVTRQGKQTPSVSGCWRCNVGVAVTAQPSR
jgi:hypothetical protein